MSFSVEMEPRKNARGGTVQAVIVNIDGHESVLTFASKDDAESFAKVEGARLVENDKKASQRVREIAHRLWQEQGCPKARNYGIGLPPRRMRPSPTLAEPEFGRMAPPWNRARFPLRWYLAFRAARREPACPRAAQHRPLGAASPSATSSDK
jgi:Protein of unknown function (DUF2934)